MLSSMTPTIVEDLDGDLMLVLGSPGGSTIITTVAQIIVNVIDFDMPLRCGYNSSNLERLKSLVNSLIDLNNFSISGFKEAI